MPKQEHVRRNSNSGSLSTGASSSTRFVMRRAYLASYNALQCALWLRILYYCMAMLVTAFANAGSPEDIQVEQRQRFYNLMITPLMTAQVLSVMEILHAAVGVVRSSPLPALAQVFGRLLHIFAGMATLPAYQSTVWVLLLVLVWCWADIPRYTLYLLLQLQGPASPADKASSSGFLASLIAFYSHIRYNTFVLLYPMGFALECVIHTYAVRALNESSSSSSWALPLPNALNVSVYPQYAWRAWTVTCAVGLYVLMSHMLRQRAKFYATRGGDAANSKRGQRSGKPTPVLPPKKRD